MFVLRDCGLSDGNIRAESAQQIFAQLVKDAPSAENLGYLAMAEAGAGNLAQAIGHFQRSIRLGNNWASVHYNLGIACLQAGRREDAHAHMVP